MLAFQFDPSGQFYHHGESKILVTSIGTSENQDALK